MVLMSCSRITLPGDGCFKSVSRRVLHSAVDSLSNHMSEICFHDDGPPIKAGLRKDELSRRPAHAMVAGGPRGDDYPVSGIHMPLWRVSRSLWDRKHKDSTGKGSPRTCRVMVVPRPLKRPR